MARIARSRGAKFIKRHRGVIVPFDDESRAILEAATVDVAARLGFASAEVYRMATPDMRRAALERLRGQH